MKSINETTISHFHHVTESVQKHLHLIRECNPGNIDINTLVGFNNRLIISNCSAFLEAVKNEIGGEIINDSNIGTFLYYGEMN